MWLSRISIAEEFKRGINLETGVIAMSQNASATRAADPQSQLGRIHQERQGPALI